MTALLASGSSKVWKSERERLSEMQWVERTVERSRRRPVARLLSDGGLTRAKKLSPLRALRLYEAVLCSNRQPRGRIGAVRS